MAGLVNDSDIYFDVEGTYKEIKDYGTSIISQDHVDLKAQKWIRIHPGPNQLYRIHPGVKVRIVMHDHNRHHHGTLFLKVSQHALIALCWALD